MLEKQEHLKQHYVRIPVLLHFSPHLPAFRFMVGIRLNYLVDTSLLVKHAPKVRDLKQEGVLSSYWGLVFRSEAELDTGLLFGSSSSIDFLRRKKPHTTSGNIGSSFEFHIGYNFAKLFK